MTLVLAFLDALLRTLFAAMKPRASRVAENLALRQQLAVLKRATPRRQSSMTPFQPAQSPANDPRGCV